MSLALVSTLSLLFATAALAQSKSATDGTTPPGMTPGAPAGSYSLSGFENVNLYSGNLNFHLPLVKVGGRGGAQVTSFLSLDSIHWRVDKTTLSSDTPETPVCGTEKLPCGHEPITGSSNLWWTTATPDPNWWEGLHVGYGPGVMHARRQNYSGSKSSTGAATVLTRLTFTANDGTEYELRDVAQSGDPIYLTYGQSVSRGTVFVSADGVSATFISDTEIVDVNNTDANMAPPLSYPTGYLLLPDGTRYRIVSGLVSWIQDRHGNRVTFAYDAAHRVQLITDSLGRQVSIAYDVNDAAHGLCDRISFSGFGGAAHQIDISKVDLGSALRPGSGYSLKTDTELFPPLDGNGQLFSETVASAVWLPDNRCYLLFYNPYGELARVVLPTGGIIDYNYTASSGVDQASKEIHRRVTERRVYRDGAALAAGQAEVVQSYQESYPSASETVVVEQQTSSTGEVVARSRHHFRGSAIAYQSPSMFYPPWDSGKEDVTEALRLDTTATDSTAVLRRVTQEWRPGTPLSQWATDPHTVGGPYVSSTTTTLPDASLVSKQVFGYDRYNNQTDAWDYDFGTSAPPQYAVRHAHTDYLTAPAYVNADLNPALGASLRSLVSAQQVFAVDSATGAESIVSKTETRYDETAYPLFTYDGISVPGWVDPATAARGDATSLRSYIKASATAAADQPCPADVCVETHARFDQLGNLRRSWDAQGNESNITYDDSFCNDHVKCDGSYTPHTFAFPTLAQTPKPDPTGTYGSAAALQTSTVYDFYTGLVYSQTDANNQTTIFSYANAQGIADPLDRLRAVERPDHSRTDYTYGDDIGNLYVRVVTDLDSTRKTEARQFFDGLGRLSRQATYENSDAAHPWLTVDTAYDALGRARKVSLPYRAAEGGAAFSTDRWTETSYDGLGRVKTVTTRPDGATVTTAYSGQYVTVTDQAGKQRRSKTDALGRLIRVDEPDQNGNLGTTDAPAQPTFYSYDVLGNLRKVDQGGQLRFFMYDSLSRLIRAKNPEQAAISFADNDADFPALTDNASGTSNSAWSLAYAYDGNGNLRLRKDARGIKTTYVYDALNRNVTTTYSNSPRTIERHYDGALHGKGRIWYSNAGGEYTTNSDVDQTVVDEYDVLGRPTRGRQHFKQNGVGSPAFTISRTYDCAGHVLTETYPSNHQVTYRYDAAGRLADQDGQPAFTGTLGDGAPRTYASEVRYHELGGMEQERFGTETPLYNKHLFNSRGQLAEIRVGTYALTDPDPQKRTDSARGAIINFYSNAEGAQGASGGGPDNNGNLLKQQTFVATGAGSSVNWMQYYDYDSLNRLSRVTEAGGAVSFVQDYSYDRWGNRTIKADTTVNAPAPQFDTRQLSANNRLYAPGDLDLPDEQRRIRYDAAGNQTRDTYQGGRQGGGERTYDAENRMTSAQFVNGQTQTATYTYDAEGRRVRRRAGVAGEVWQVYDFDGELLAEYAASSAPSAPQKEYGYRAGALLVTATGTGANTNLALGRGAAQSSDYPGPGVDASLALDGNVNSVAHTAYQAQPWWQTDLGAVREISSVKLWNRPDCCQERLSNFYIFVSDVPFTTTDPAATAAQAGVGAYYVAGAAPLTLEQAVHRTGRYVRVQLTGTNFLSLAEVQVLGPALAPPVAGSGFESPALAAGAFQVAPAGAQWTFAGGAGIASNGSGYTAANPSAPEGSQVAFLQGAGGSISQQIAGFEERTGYAITFKAAQRANCCGAGGQDFDLYLDGMRLGRFRPSGTAYETLRTPAFATSAGTHTLKLVGRNSAGGDNTALLDDIRVVPAEETEARVVALAATASGATAGAGPQNVIDGDTTTTWLSGGFAPQWIQLDLGAAYQLTRVRLRVNQSPAGQTTHQVYGGPSPTQLTPLGTFDGNTSSGQWLELQTSATQVRYLRVLTTQSPSWAAWDEVEVYASTGPQLLTPQAATASSSYTSSGPQNATDGDLTTSWLSGGFAPAWIQLDLGRSYTLAKVRLNVNQSPAGHTTHEVYGGTDAGQMVLLGRLDAQTQSGQWLELATAGQTVRYLRVLTTASPSWVGWNEIEAYGTPVGGEVSDVEWVVADQLGTPRMVVDESGTLSGVKHHDYLPFGEETQAGIGGRTINEGYGIADGVKQHFTGKLRDDETGLDYFEARYYSSTQGRFTSVDLVMMKKARLLNPQQINLYEYVGDNPLKYVDLNGEDLILANATAQTRIREVLAPGLSKAEMQNLKVEGNRVELRDPGAIRPEGASPAYKYLSQIIMKKDLTVNYYAVGAGQSVIVNGTKIAYDDAVKARGITTGAAGDSVRDVIVPVGGAPDVKGLPAGSGNTVPMPEDVIFAHEAYGHVLHPMYNDAVGVENEYRASRNPALSPRSGEDHGTEVNVTAPLDEVHTTSIPLGTTTVPKPIIPQPTPPKR